MKLTAKKANFGTAPVFFTAISTILGAVMFLRFGYAVGHTGFLGAIGIVLFGHLVTIPTAMAIAEIATNQKVEGGGEYHIISRSFGINVGAAIGIALYMSQAISVAFYIIAFAEAFDPVFDWLNSAFGILITEKRMISIPAILLLSTLILKKGANLGMKALYVVVAILFISLILFFMGKTDYSLEVTSFPWLETVKDSDTSFFKVFAIVFPAFTGMTAGVGLSGDLRNPRKSIPFGTIAATLTGLVIYGLIAWKLAVSASPEDLANPDNQLIMGDIALFGPIIPIGLAAATISSALGSIMVAPRTLQALAADGIFPVRIINSWFSMGKGKTAEPFNATIITSIIALFFVALGDVNAVAEIISMFFMITYGSLCLISFLQHFAADPSYRPSFRSKWYLSLMGAVLCLYLMFSMNQQYAFISIGFMAFLYIAITFRKKDSEGLAKIFQGVIFQVSRQLQVFLQNADKREDNWRPSVICISSSFFIRPNAFTLLRWISHRYGFGTYIHYIKGYFSRESNLKAREELKRLVKLTGETKSNVYIDTMISPSFTSAIAQAIQLPSVSGKEINTILFEYARTNEEALGAIIDNFSLVNSAGCDVCILSTADKEFGFMKTIHIWITPNDLANGNLMILMGYVIMGHPDWKKAKIKILC
ncbi:MAG: amino acid permease, partial [Cyclobacteriaceae bacterium]|nr:amino acid permease [Cyclobacteriaceae bacterium]